MPRTKRRPREVPDGDRVEAIPRVHDAGEGVVPRGQGSKQPEQLAGGAEVHDGADVAGGLQMGDAEEQVVQVEEEEEQEEGDVGLERAQEEKGGQDEPGLWMGGCVSILAPSVHSWGWLPS
jgi:hypothetical protein